MPAGSPYLANPREQRPLLSEYQVQKRLLIVDASRLPQDIEVGVVLVHLPAGHVGAVRSARSPALGQQSQLKVRTDLDRGRRDLGRSGVRLCWNCGYAERRILQDSRYQPPYLLDPSDIQ